MYWPRSGIKKHPEKRWNQPDRVFFGFGACHILAGVYLENAPLDGFYGEWIVPVKGYKGHHMYVTNGSIAFDYHGYSQREKLLTHYWKGWRERYVGWDANIQKIDFPLLETVELNKRKHLGPDQFFDDPIPRARQFISSFQHPT
ncbi:hypothetical protein WH96_16925 [Kiloniella spongiae]|uniref:Uncharacterized protein n=1 Tax=Kiloniella spongiae TaxID=1489064 RepID=A0A0H2MSE0_9PROT|nr:hypothetical protein [Kiloniella spongiae]KLN59555.1 hypothetical protein WH96_16925 [Kiloniella spongiae]